MQINVAGLRDYILARAQERMTWLGLISLAGAVGWTIPDPIAQSIASIGVWVAGGLCVVLKEQGPKAPAAPIIEQHPG